jgi:type II secretion system protein J
VTQRTATTRAFTLLEMLVAIALIAVVAGSLYASLNIAFRARRSALGVTESVRRAELALDLVRQDLQAAMLPRGVLAGIFTGTDDQDAQGRDADSLVLYASVPDLEPTQGIGDVKQIELACETSDDGRSQVLVRLTTANLLAPQTPEPEREVLCTGVYAFNLRYFDGSEWQDTWDSSTQDDALPVAIEVTLQLTGDERRGEDGGYSASRVFLVPCGVPASDATETTGSSS